MTQQPSLQGVATAAVLRSEPALWRALEAALNAGATREDLEAAIETAAQIAAEAIRAEAHKTLTEVLARQGARDRWGIPREDKR